MKNITPIEAAQVLKEDSGTVLVDVRTPSEVAEVSISSAKNIPLDQLSSQIEELKKYSNVLFICRSGGRSMSAAMIAESLKLPVVTNVMGGIMAWMQAGLPVKRVDNPQMSL